MIEKTLRRGLLAAAVLSGSVTCATAQDKPADKAAPPAANAVGADPAWDTSVTPDKKKDGATEAAPALVLDPRQVELVTQINKYFNELTTLKGVFVQTAADNKRMKGKFFVQKPGRFRFDYSLPSKQIIISDGDQLAIQDMDLNNEDRVSLDQTPFRMLLRKDVDLMRDAKIEGIEAAEDLIILTMQDKDPEAPGRIRLFLTSKPAVEIKEWITTDAQGLDTRVEVADLVRGETLDAELFKIKPVGLMKAP